MDAAARRADATERTAAATAPTGAQGVLDSCNTPALLSSRYSVAHQKRKHIAVCLAITNKDTGLFAVELWDTRGKGMFIHFTYFLTLWLNSTMCSSDSCFSEILGLEKHVCCADSRTTNFTRLTFPQSVRPSEGVMF